jgi:tetratricopeptide (TPR) repeat protein
MPTRLSLFCDKVIEGGWLAAIIAAPLFFNVYSSRVFEPDKLTLVRSIALVMAVAWLIKVAETRLRPEGAPEAVRAQDAEFGPANPVSSLLRGLAVVPLALPVILLVLVYLISTALSIAPGVSLWGSYQRLQGTYTTFSYIIVFALAVTNLRQRAQMERLVTTVIIVSLPIALYGLIQHYKLDPLPWGGDVVSRVASNMGNAIFLAAYLIMVLPLTLYRLTRAMGTILSAEEVSWSATVQAAAYIFILAVQFIALVFAQSRGPTLGFLAGLFFFVLLALMVLRQQAQAEAPLSALDALKAFLFAVASPIGAALPVYAVMVALRKGLRWLWLSWCLQAIFFAIFLVVLNIPNGPLTFVSSIPYTGRSLSLVFELETGTGKVRNLIWGGALRLIAPHEPLGVPGQFMDSFNPVRPLIGYGPESMFNAFAKFYPPELTTVESRGSSADRCHNESFDSLVITGLLGFLAYAFLMVSIFYHTMTWLGLADTPGRRRLLLGLFLGGIAVGMAVPWAIDLSGIRPGTRTLMGLAMPAGMSLGLFVYCLLRGFMSGEPADRGRMESWRWFLMIGLFAGIIAHFVESHFGISIASTRTHFWVYAAALLVLGVYWPAVQPSPAIVTAEGPPALEVTTARRRRRRRSAHTTDQEPVQSAVVAQRQESWEISTMAQALVICLIIVTLIYDFVTPQFTFEAGRYSMLWLFTITWILSGVLILASQGDRKEFRPGWALLVFVVLSLSYALLFAAVHWSQLHTRINATTIEDIVRASGVTADALAYFYIAFFALLLIMAASMARTTWSSAGAPLWRSGNWWLYPPLILGLVFVILKTNLNPIQADIYFKQGDSYRGMNRLNESLALYQKTISLAPDQDFYYLMLALNYQLMSQGTQTPEQRLAFFQEGVRTAQQAREINPYNPDNTGNLGRFYFTWGQIQDASKFEQALDYFRQATYLAPQNVIYYNLWGQTLYVQGKYAEAIELYKRSREIDNWFPQTPILLGDAYAALGRIDEALAAHSEAIRLDPRSFVDPAFEQRLKFYLSGGKGDGLVQAFRDAAVKWPDDPFIPANIGYIYAQQNRYPEAIAAYQQAIAEGDRSTQTLLRLGDAYLATQQWVQATAAYEQVIAQEPNQVQAHSSLGYAYARQGRLEDAVRENLTVLQLSPNDYNSHKNLAILYQQLGHLDEALAEAQKALAMAPDNEKAALEGFIAQIKQQKAQKG